MAGILTGTQVNARIADILERSDKTDEIAEWVQNAITYIYHVTRFQGMESKATFDTVANTSEYVLSPFYDESKEDIFKIVGMYLDDEGESQPIRQITHERAEEVYPNPTDNTARPQVYYLWARTVNLRPIPNDAYTITMHTLIKPPTFTDLDTFILDGLDRAIIALAVGMGFEDLGDEERGELWRKRGENWIGMRMEGEGKDLDECLQPFSLSGPVRAMDDQVDPWRGVTR